MSRKDKVGTIIVDSASFWVGDPAYVDCFGRTVTDFCGRERICQVRGYGTLVVDGVTGYTPDGDGEFPVYAEYDENGGLLRVILEFDEQE